MYKLTSYQDIAAESIKIDKQRNDMFDGIDKMWENDWELPKTLSDKEWMRSFISTGPHDAMLAATRVFAAQFPSVSVQPLAPNQGELDETERVESLLDWHLFQTLRRGVNSPLWSIMNHAVRYSMVSFQTEYLPLKFKGRKDAMARAYKRSGDFAFVMHNPSNVHPRFGSYGLDCVTLAYLTSCLEIYNTFGKDNPGVRKMVSKLENASTALEAILAKTKVTLYDYTDYENRVQWISIGEQFDDTGGKVDGIEILRAPHELPFMNWVVKMDDHPLMKPVYDANLWENTNVLESIRYYRVLSTIAQATTWSRTPSGEGVDVDHTEPGAQVRMRAGEEAGIFPPTVIDPNINVLIDAVRGDIRQTTVAQALTTLENLPGGTPYATINAILQAAISTLAPIRNIGESAIEESLYQMLMWAKQSGEPLNGLMRKGKSTVEETLSLGAGISLSPDEIDPENTYITVRLDAESPTDKQARMNMAILEAERLPVSPRKAMEDNGMEYTDADQEEWLKWGYMATEKSADEKRIIGLVDVELQQKMMESQQPQQPSPQQQVQANNSMGATQGTDTRMGGASPYEGQPGMTRESVTGQSVSGEEA